MYTRIVLLTDMICSYNRKPFLEALGNVGLCKLLEPYEDKTAEAVCTLGYSPGPESEPMIFQGRLLVCIALSIHEGEIPKWHALTLRQGRIVLPRGVSSFGKAKINSVSTVITVNRVGTNI